MAEITVAVRDRTRRGVASVARNLTTLKDKAQAATRSMQGLGDRTEKTGVQFAQSAMRMAGFSLALGSVGIAMRSVIKTGSDFEFTMARVGAVTGATGKDFDSLNKQAKELGASTVFSASEAADAMQFLGMAGMKTNEIMSAMPTTLQLAAAGAMELGETADIVTNILSGMRLEMSELESVANGLAVAATSSNTSIALLGESFTYASGVSASVGLEFSDVAAALGKLGDAGSKGSSAGMNLAMALTKVLDPTKEAAKVMEDLQLEFMNADGTMVSLVEMIQQLEKAQISAQEQFQIFGVQGGRAIAALLAAGAPALEKLRDSIETNNTALEEMSDKMGGTTQNKMKALTSAVEGLQLEMFDNLAPALIDTVEQLTLIARSDDAVQVMKDLGVAAGELATALIGIGKFVREYGDELAVLGIIFGAGKAGSLLAKGAATVGAGGAAAALPGVALATGVGVGGAAYARSKIDPMVAEEGAGNVFDVIGNAIRDGFNRLWYDAPETAFTGGFPTNEEPRWAVDLIEEVKQSGAMTNESAAGSILSAAPVRPIAMPLEETLDYAAEAAEMMSDLNSELDNTVDLSGRTAEHYGHLFDLDTRKLELGVAMAQTETERSVAEEELLRHQLKGRNITGDLADEFVKLNKQLKEAKDLAPDTITIADGMFEVSEETKEAIDKMMQFGDAVKQSIPEVDALMNVIQGFMAGGPLGGAIAGFTSLVGIMESGQKSAEEMGQAIQDMLNEGARGTRDAMELLYGEGELKTAQERVFAPLLEFYNSLQAGSGPERVKAFFDAMAAFDLQGDVYSIDAQNSLAKMIDTFFGEVATSYNDTGNARVTWINAQRDFMAGIREAFGGEMSFVDLGLEMVETGDAFEGLRESAAAAKDAVNGLSDAEDRHTRLVYDQQEIAARGGLAQNIQRAGGDIFAQRQAYLQFQEVIASIRRSETLARSRGGTGTPAAAAAAAAGTGGNTGVLNTPAGNALTLSPITPTNWNTIVDEDTLRAATPIPVVWSEILALLDRSHTRIGNTGSGDNLGHWELVVDTGNLRGMTKIDVAWKEVLDIDDKIGAAAGYGSDMGARSLTKWDEVVDKDLFPTLKKVKVKWSEVLELLDVEHTRIGNPAAKDSLDHWDEIIDAPALRAMPKAKFKWSEVLELLDKSHTRIGNPEAGDTLNKWELVVDADNLRSMQKINVNWSEIINPTKSDISLNDVLSFDPFNFSESQNWHMFVLPQLRSGIKDSVEGLSVSVNLANIIDFNTADLSDAISRAVQEAIDDRQIEPMSTTFAADPFGRG